MRFLSAMALALSFVAMTSRSALAQTSFSMAAGAAVPVGASGEQMKMGYNATVGVGIKPTSAPIGASIEGMFNSFAFKTTGVADSSRRIIGLAGNVIITGPGAPLPVAYLIGGIGMYSSKIAGDVIPQDANEDLGFNVGAGFNAALREINAFLEIRYHRIASEAGAITLVPILVGLRF